MKANRYDELMAKQMQEYNAFPIGRRIMKNNLLK